MEDTASFGYWVRRRRKALDLTQDELARRVGCAVVTIKKIEADERRPSRQMAERLADCLAIPPAERAAFLRSARGELSPYRLALPTQPVSISPAPPANLPTGTVTFLFTDVEGSTGLWQGYPDAIRQALARHDALVQGCVEEHGGVLVRPRGEGDSRFAVFAQASDAVVAACALARRWRFEYGHLAAVDINPPDVARGERGVAARRRPPSRRCAGRGGLLKPGFSTPNFLRRSTDRARHRRL